MAPRRSSRAPIPSQRRLGGLTLQSTQASQATAAAGLLALNAGVVRRSRSRSVRPRVNPAPLRRRGSSTTASASDEAGGSEGDENIDEEADKGQQESNSRYRRTHGLPILPRDPSRVPDSAQATQEYSTSPAASPQSGLFEDPDDEVTLRRLKHFNFQVVSQIKNKIVGGDTVNTKDWSYQGWLTREQVKLQARLNHLPNQRVILPTFASEMRIRAQGMSKPISVPIMVDADLTNSLRAMYNVRSQQERKGAWAELVVPFGLVVDTPPAPSATAPSGTPNASHPARRTATVRQREAASERAQIAEIVGDSHTLIAAKYACPDTTCPNNPRPCIVTPGQGHLPLNTRAVRDWCTWIRGGTATIDRPPPSLISRLIKEHGKRVGGQASLAKSDSSPGGVNLYFGGGTTEAGAFRPPLASSPPGSVSGNDDVNTERYVDWLIAEGHGKQEQLQHAKSALDDHGWGYSDLRKITKEQWSEMGVPGGVQEKVRKHWKTWAKVADDAIDTSDDMFNV